MVEFHLQRYKNLNETDARLLLLLLLGAVIRVGQTRMKKMKQKQQAWKVEIEAKKADGLAFGLKATKALPPPATAAARKLFRFSLRLKLSSVVIHVKSKHKPSVWPNPLKFFKSKFAPKFSDKFRGRTIPAAAAKTTLNIPPPPRWKAMTIIKGWDCCGGGSSSASLQNLYLLRQSISQKDQNGIVLQLAVNVSGWTGPIRYVASSVFENDAGFGRKLSIILVLLLLVTVFISPSLRCASSLSVGGAFGILQSLGIRIKSFQLNVRSFAVENSDGLIFR